MKATLQFRLIILLFLLNFISMEAQVLQTASNCYLIYLKDKKYTPYNLTNPGAFLSERALARRNKHGIAIDSTDLPVCKNYLDSLQKLGVTPYNVSRWYNTVTIQTEDTALIRVIESQSYVQKTEAIKKLNLTPATTQMNASASAYYADSKEYGAAYQQIWIHNGNHLHYKGYRGEGMLIAIIDAGFNNYLTMSAFENIRKENRIMAVKDFVAHDGEVNSDHYHGAHVFSIIGGELTNKFIGTAPHADFLLLRSEDATLNGQGFQNENPVEEDNWISAIEYADSLGADVVNTSLGYTTFNIPAMNHRYPDMDGQTTRISKAAHRASQKGIIVVVSAGNEGSNSWRYISAPADAKDVLTVGAVNINHAQAPFSSVGPTYDGRIKPDVMATGQGTYVQTTNNDIISGNGTSYSAPIITGLTACLWQSSPERTNLEIMDAIRKCSDNYETPDNYYGYGIPDFKKALYLLNPELYDYSGKLLPFPNPFSSYLNLQYEPLQLSSLNVEIYNLAGKKVYTRLCPIETNRVSSIHLDDLSFLPKGVYIFRSVAAEKVLTGKAIKQ